MEDEIKNIINIVKEMDNESHLDIYNFIQTQKILLQCTSVNQNGVYIDLKNCEYNELYELINYVYKIKKISTIYIKNSNKLIYIPYSANKKLSQ
tara:strand:+ start:86 stop:367 length:282 start_codon:yes stop_codon:yes gene_type:complete